MHSRPHNPSTLYPRYIPAQGPDQGCRAHARPSESVVKEGQNWHLKSPGRKAIQVRVLSRGEIK
jgi:hypothetical protein